MNLLNIQLVEQLFLLQANIVYPLLILLDSPIFFLVIIGVHNVEGVIIAFQSKQRRVSNIFLAIYPLLFHVSFIIFYCCPFDSVITIATIISLISLLLGFIHNISIMILDIVMFLYKLIRLCFNPSKIEPQDNEKPAKENKNSAIISNNERI